MLIAVSSFGKGLRWIFLTEPAEAIFCYQESPLLSFVFRNRQYHRERGTLPHDRIHPDAPLMVVNDGFDNR